MEDLKARIKAGFESMKLDEDIRQNTLKKILWKGYVSGSQHETLYEPDSLTHAEVLCEREDAGLWRHKAFRVQAKSCIRHRKGFLLKPAAAAACFIMIGTLGAVTYASGWCGLRAVSMGHSVTQTLKEVEIPDTELPDGGEASDAPVTEWRIVTQELEFISTAGVKGSAEYEAQKEWVDYYWTHPITTPIQSAEYLGWYESLYDCTDEDMVRKVDEIMAKYGLTHYKDITYIDSIEEFCRELGYEEIFSSGKVISASGYYYDEGSFNLEGVHELDDGTLVLYSILRNVRGALHPNVINIGNAASYSENQYRTKTDVDISMFTRYETYEDASGYEQGEQAILLTDRPQSRVTINIISARDDGAIPPIEKLEEFTECIRYDLIK